MADAIFRLKDTFKIFKIIWGPSGGESGGGTNNEAALVQSDLRREFSQMPRYTRAHRSQRPETRELFMTYNKLGIKKGALSAFVLFDPRF